MIGLSTMPLGPCTLPFSGHLSAQSSFTAVSAAVSSIHPLPPFTAPVALHVHLHLPLVTRATFLQPVPISPLLL